MYYSQSVETEWQAVTVALKLAPPDSFMSRAVRGNATVATGQKIGSNFSRTELKNKAPEIGVFLKRVVCMHGLGVEPLSSRVESL